MTGNPRYRYGYSFGSGDGTTPTPPSESAGVGDQNATDRACAARGDDVSRNRPGYQPSGKYEDMPPPRSMTDRLRARFPNLDEDPTPENPWVSSLSWNPHQNGGLVSMLRGRVDVMTILGQLARVTPETVAEEYGCTVQDARVLAKLLDDLREAGWAPPDD